jgi:alternate signal-mediated exported protein
LRLKAADPGAHSGHTLRLSPKEATLVKTPRQTKRQTPRQTSRRRARGPRHAIMAVDGLVSRGRRVFVALAATVGVLGGALVTLALWNNQATVAGPIITTGHLRLVEGSFTWKETSQDVPKESLGGGADLAGLAEIHATPGDSFEISQGVQIDAAGANLSFDLTVNWAEPEGGAATAPLTASYDLLDSDGKTVAAAAVGTPSRVQGLTAGEHTFTVVVTLVYALGEPIYQQTPQPTDQISALPALTVAAEQVGGTP